MVERWTSDFIQGILQMTKTVFSIVKTAKSKIISMFTTDELMENKEFVGVKKENVNIGWPLISCLKWLEGVGTYSYWKA